VRVNRSANPLHAQAMPIRHGLRAKRNIRMRLLTPY
jgi:hypothetical protein